MKSKERFNAEEWDSMDNLESPKKVKYEFEEETDSNNHNIVNTNTVNTSTNNSNKNANNLSQNQKSSKKLLTVLICAIILLVIIVGVLIYFLGGNKTEKTDYSVQSTTIIKTPETTTEPTTRMAVRPKEKPKPVSYNLYIDEDNKEAYTVFEWTSIAGEFDGYQIDYGMSENMYVGQDAKWFDTVNLNGSNITSHKVELQYATGSDIDMARIRIFYYENGEIVYGEWSERILLDFNNKVYL